MWQRESKANSVNLQANIPDSGEGCQAKSTIQLFSCRLVSSIENGQLFSIRLSQNLDKVGEKQKKKKKKSVGATTMLFAGSTGKMKLNRVRFVTKV